jgi:hypothetical protein
LEKSIRIIYMSKNESASTSGKDERSPPGINESREEKLTNETEDGKNIERANTALGASAGAVAGIIAAAILPEVAIITGIGCGDRWRDR